MSTSWKMVSLRITQYGPSIERHKRIHQAVEQEVEIGYNKERVRGEGNIEEARSEGYNTEQKEERNNDDSDVVHESHDIECFDVKEVLRHIGHEEIVENKTRGLQILEKVSKDLLYAESNGCNKECTILQTMLDLLTLKAKNGWSDTSLNELLELLAKLLPKPNNLPTSTYLAKKFLSLLTLGIQKNTRLSRTTAYCTAKSTQTM